MAKVAAAHKVEAKEEIPTVVTYHVALAHSTTYYRWRHIGTEQRLMTDEEIACFLMEFYYEKKASNPPGGSICPTCQSLLKLSCLNCGTASAPVSVEDQTGTHFDGEALTTHTANSLEVSLGSDDDGAADSGGDNDDQDMTVTEPSTNYGMNLRSRRRVVSPAQNRKRTRKLRSQRSRRLKTDPDRSLETPETQQVNQYVDCSIPSGADPSEATLEPSPEQRDDQNLPLDENRPSVDEERCKEEMVGESDENASSSLPSRTPHAGRGRPRKYPYIPLECSVCHKKLSTRVSVVNHMKKKHPETKLPDFYHSVISQKPGPKPRKCPGRGQRKNRTEKSNTIASEDEVTSASADEKLHTKTEMGEAIRQLRKAELESLKCATCGVQFEHKRQMYTHRRLCLSKVCHLCGKSVKQLEMHLKRHTSARRFPCPHCPKSFLFRNYLEQHMLYHNNERPYCCEICGMRYREKTRLNAHIRTHTGSKPYKCNLCEAAFTRPRGLNDHMRVHTGEKPYSCQVCGRQFSSSGNLAAHRRKVHGMQPQVPNRMTRKLFVVESVESGGADAGVDENVIKTDSIDSMVAMGAETVSSPGDPFSIGVLDTDPGVSVNNGGVSCNNLVVPDNNYSAHVGSPGLPVTVGLPDSVVPVGSVVYQLSVSNPGGPVNSDVHINSAGVPVSNLRVSVSNAGVPVSHVPVNSLGGPVDPSIPLSPSVYHHVHNLSVPADSPCVSVSNPADPFNNSGVPAGNQGIPLSSQGVGVDPHLAASPGLTLSPNITTDNSAAGHLPGVGMSL